MASKSKKKFAQLTKDVEDQKEEMSALRDREFDLRESIKNLEKDVQGHKKEIRERCDLGVPRCCGAFTSLIRLVSVRRDRGWFLF